MLQSKRAKVLVVVLAAALVVAASVAVLSQQYPSDQGQGNMPPQGQYGQGPPPMPQGPGQMGPNQPGGFGGGGRMGMGMPMMGGGTPAIVATAEYVYVVQGNTLYQFSAKTLKLANKAELTSGNPRGQTPVTPSQNPNQ